MAEPVRSKSAAGFQVTQAGEPKAGAVPVKVQAWTGKTKAEMTYTPNQQGRFGKPSFGVESEIGDVGVQAELKGRELNAAATIAQRKLPFLPAPADITASGQDILNDPRAGLGIRVPGKNVQVEANISSSFDGKNVQGFFGASGDTQPVVKKVAETISKIFGN